MDASVSDVSARVAVYNSIVYFVASQSILPAGDNIKGEQPVKGSRIAVIAGGAALALGSMAPAQAAGPYTIAVASTFTSGVRQTFEKSGCNAALVSAPSNGTDAAIVDASGLQGPRVISWSSLGAQSPVGRLGVFFYNGACQLVFDATNDGAIYGPAELFNIPAGTRWIVVESFVNTPVTFHVG